MLVRALKELPNLPKTTGIDSRTVQRLVPSVQAGTKSPTVCACVCRHTVNYGSFMVQIGIAKAYNATMLLKHRVYCILRNVCFKQMALECAVNLSHRVHTVQSAFSESLLKQLGLLAGTRME